MSIDFFKISAEGGGWYDGEFLSAAEIDAREKLKAKQQAEATGSRAPVGQKEQAAINMAEQRVAKEKAQEEKEMWAEMHQENIRWAKDNDLWDYEKNEIIDDPYYKKPEGLFAAKRREEEERKARELVYYNEERKGMASSGAGMSEFYERFPDQKQTSYFAPENKATGDTREWDEIKEDFVSGKDDGPVMNNPYQGEGLDYRDTVFEFMYGDAYTNQRDNSGGLGGTVGYNMIGVPDYYTDQYRVPYDSPEGKDFVMDVPPTIEGAKSKADEFYIESLNRSLEKASTDQERAQIQSLINSGAPTFRTREDFQSYYELGGEVAQNKKELLDSGVDEADIPFSAKSELKDALQIQEDYMASWVYFGDGRNSWAAEDSGALIFKHNPEADYDSFKDGDAFLNTGTGFTRTSLGGFLEDPTYQLAGFGENTYWIKRPELRKKTGGFMGKLMDKMDVVLDIASILYPPAAPLLQAGKTLQQGGDFEDVLKAGVGTWAAGKVSDIAFDDVIETYVDFGVPIDKLSEVQQKVIVDTTIDGLRGKSIQDSLEENAGKALVKGGVDAIGEILSDIDIEIDGEFQTPEWLEKAGDVVVATGTAIGNAVEPIVKPVYEGVKAVGDVVEPVAKDIVDAGQQAVDVVQEAVQPISDFTSDVEDDILDAGRAFDDTVIDPIDDVIDTFGEEVVDPVLQAGSDVLSDAEDVVSDVLSEGEDLLKEAGYVIDDLVDWESLLKNHFASEGSGAKTPTESLFEGEIYKTPLKQSPDKIFSDEAIAGFLNREKNKNTGNLNSISSLLFSDPKNTEEEKLKASARKRQNIRKELLSSSNQRINGLFL